jgi:BirA family transcriptional regulator, biotin operon repressor / biotin---[acetyl-CoA-carboxylase] ligase
MKVKCSCESSSAMKSTAIHPADAEPAIYAVDGWTVHEYTVIDSSNLIAANLPAWNAVRAATQTAGRGRFQRSWVSDEGGLWLSAVVPTGVDPLRWRALPLAAGLVVCEVLHGVEVPQLRMRWPNDVLVADRKLAGLLVEQFKPGLAIVGIGVNVQNEPEKYDASLTRQTARLAEMISNPPNLRDLTLLLLRSLRSVTNQMQSHGFASLLPRVNQLWGSPRKVELDLGGNVRAGCFSRVDGEGRLVLSDESGNLCTYDAHEVVHLKEIQTS